MADSWATATAKKLKDKREKGDHDAARVIQNRSLVVSQANSVWVALCEATQNKAREVNAIEPTFKVKDFNRDSQEYLIDSAKGHVIIHLDGTGPSVRYRFVPKADPLTEDPKFQGVFQFGALKDQVHLEHPEQGLMPAERAAEYLLNMLV